MDYAIIKSKRKTVALQIKDGELTVRAPMKMSERDIARFVAEHQSWIDKHLSAAIERKKRNDGITPLSADELKTLAARAKILIPERVAHYAALLGVSYGKITLRRQKTRWGSCSSKGDLNFNLALMLAPEIIIDSVIVHELCHRKEMNHSARFYAEMARVFPAYKECRAWLKENGDALMRRAGQK